MVSVDVEGDVVEVPAAFPLIEPLCEAELAAPAGWVQGWLLVLPVALPVVPPVVGVVLVCPAALPEAEPLGLIELPALGLCAGVEGVTLCVPCDEVLVWSVLLVVVVEFVWLAALLGFCVSTLVWL